MMIDDISFLTDIALGVILFIIIIFLFLKDGESNRKLKRYEKSIEDLHYEVFKLKKEFQELQDNTSKAIDNNKQVPKFEIDKSIKDTVDTEINKLLEPLITSLDDFDNTLQNMQSSIDTKINKLNDQVKEVTSIPSTSGSVDKNKVIEMAKNGKDSEFIAKELRTTKGEIEFILKMANYI
jgi:predicted RNase H-like nuclease (RuvC/YqgF family)